MSPCSAIPAPSSPAPKSTCRPPNDVSGGSRRERRSPRPQARHRPDPSRPRGLRLVHAGRRRIRCRRRCPGLHRHTGRAGYREDPPQPLATHQLGPVQVRLRAWPVPRHRQPVPVAPSRVQLPARPLRGDRRLLPGARIRHLDRHLHPGRRGLGGHRPPDHHRDRPSRLRSSHRTTR